MSTSSKVTTDTDSPDINSFKQSLSKNIRWHGGMEKNEYAGDDDDDDDDDDDNGNAIESIEMTKSDTQPRHSVHRLSQSVGSIKYY